RVRFSFRRIIEGEDEGFQPLPYFDRLPLAKLREGESCPPGQEEVCAARCPYEPYSDQWFQRCEKVRSFSYGFGEDGARVEFACSDDFIESFNRFVTCAVNDLDIFSCDEEGVEGEGIPLVPYLTTQDCEDEGVSAFGRFGYFRTERFDYDRQLGGAHDQRRRFYANHHQLWRDAAQEQPKPIIYYLSPGYPSSLEEVTAQIGLDWDAAFIEAATLKSGRSEEALREALLADAEEAGVGAWRFLEADPLRASGLFQVRRNRCSLEGISAWRKNFVGNEERARQIDLRIEAITEDEGIQSGNLLRVCASLRHMSRREGFKPRFDWEQVGDLRFNFIRWIDDPQPSGPLGYGPSAADPETGRIISGNANVYGAAIDSYARSAADVVRLINEDLALDTLLSGQSYIDWIRAGGITIESETQGLQLEQGAAEVARAINGDFDPSAAYGDFLDPQGKLDPARFETHLRRRLARLHPQDPLSGAAEAPPTLGRQRLQTLLEDPRVQARSRDLRLETLLEPIWGEGGTDDLRPTSLSSPFAEGEEDERLSLSDAARLLATDPTSFHEETEARQRFFAEHNGYLKEFLDDSVTGLALSLVGLPAEEVYRRLRAEIYRAVMLHEIGHTLGLTHNFEASFDALNYRDEFWEEQQRLSQIREERGAEAEAAARRESRIAEHRYSSIMDYGSRFNADIQGLGRYDHAAIRFVYGGGQVEVFSDSVPVRPRVDFEILLRGYEAIPELLGGVEAIRDRESRPLLAIEGERIAGLEENSRRFIEDPLPFYRLSGSLPAATPPRPEEVHWSDRSVPYKYCFDFYNGSLECKTWDEGASHREVVRGAIQNHWSYFFFNSYRRGRDERAFVNGYLGRQGRLAAYLQYPFRYFYFYSSYDINLRNDLYAAAVNAINYVNRILGTPEPGRHCLDQERQLYIPQRQLEGDQSCESPLQIPLGDGRLFEHQLSNEYRYQIDSIGSYVEKLQLLFLLTDTSSNFFRVSNLGDERSFSIGYYRVYRDELLSLSRDLMLDWLGESTGERFQPLVLQDAEGEAQLVPRALVEQAAFDQGDVTDSTARVQSPVSYNLLWQLMLLNSAFNTSTYDGQPDFIEYITVSEVGSGDDREVEAGRTSVEFIHPETGLRYRATESIDERSLAVELLERADRFVELRYQPALSALEASPEDEQALDAFAESRRQLERYVGLISDMRLLRELLDWYRD
ncbi:MAG: zinc-dependent metalloprotease, partial [Myxococcota bacterium]|nr:zinc-dependent metalloprotease [Myxococcota bacterium]